MVTLDQNGTEAYEEDVHPDNSSEIDSDDEALLEMLGLKSMNDVVKGIVIDDDNDDNDSDDERSIRDNTFCFRTPIPDISEDVLKSITKTLQDDYREQSICVLPRQCSISPEHMRRLTEELVWCGQNIQADRTYETIKIWKNGNIEERRTLTRLENFVDAHSGWSDLCHGYIKRLLSSLFGFEVVLYKEKLNIKPSGGTGFAPHLDSPSLRVAFGQEGPQTFFTVMIAIDDATRQNGCLRICRGKWNEDNCCQVIQPEEDGNPDAGGRAGAIIPDIAERLEFDDLLCKGGTISVFNGWLPHRSGANTSPFPRRAVFLTYNPMSEGDFHKKYYKEMEKLRNEWREKVGFSNRQHLSEDEKFEMNALVTIPKI